MLSVIICYLSSLFCHSFVLLCVLCYLLPFPDFHLCLVVNPALTLFTCVSVLVLFSLCLRPVVVQSSPVQSRVHHGNTLVYFFVPGICLKTLSVDFLNYRAFNSHSLSLSAHGSCLQISPIKFSNYI